MRFSSPLRYPGGKSRLSKTILQYSPMITGNFSIKEYREPFFGGGSVFFEVLNNNSKFQIETFEIADTFYELYNFWRVAKNHTKELYEKINDKRTTFKDNGRALHALCKNILLGDVVLPQKQTEMDLAVAFFILNRISFSGLTLSGGYSQASFDTRFCDSHIQRILTCEESLKDVNVSNNSYEHLLQKPGKDVWIYLDPPYDINSKTLYGINGRLHSSFDHEKFAAACKSCKHKWLVSYNDNSYIRDLFSWANIKEANFVYNMNSRNKKATELFIMNY